MSGTTQVDAIKSIMLEKKQTHFWLRIRYQVLDETPCMHSSGAEGQPTCCTMKTGFRIRGRVGHPKTLFCLRTARLDVWRSHI